MNPLEEFGARLAPPTAEPPTALRQRVLAQREERIGTPRFRRTVLSGPRRFAGTVAALAAATALIAVVLPGGIVGPVAVRPPRDTMSPETSAARIQTAGQVLELAAQRLAVAPALVARPDQFVYLESVAVYQEVRADGGWTIATPPTLVREWRSVDGTADSVTEQRPVDAAGAIVDTFRIPGCRNGFLSGTQTACHPAPGYDSRLPTDGGAMYTYLYQAGDDDLPGGYGAQIGPDERAVERAAYVLYLGQTSPAVQSAVFAALGRVPGVTVQPGVSDVAGRPGVALVDHGPSGVTELIFDPHTYQYLGMSRTLPQLAAADRTHGAIIRLVTEQAFQRVAIVDHAGLVP
jgi:hypothetical protein